MVASASLEQEQAPSLHRASMTLIKPYAQKRAVEYRCDCCGRYSAFAGT